MQLGGSIIGLVGDSVGFLGLKHGITLTENWVKSEKYG